MPYQVRAKGEVVAVYERQRDALEHVRKLVAANPDVDAEIVNAATGEPAAPAASHAEREDYATKVGF